MATSGFRCFISPLWWHFQRVITQAKLDICAPITKPAIKCVGLEELGRAHPASTLESTTATCGNGRARLGIRMPLTLCDKGPPVPYPASLDHPFYRQPLSPTAQWHGARSRSIAGD